MGVYIPGFITLSSNGVTRLQYTTNPEFGVPIENHALHFILDELTTNMARTFPNKKQYQYCVNNTAPPKVQQKKNASSRQR